MPWQDGKSWLGLVHEVGLLGVPLVFDRVHPSVTLLARCGRTVATMNAGSGDSRVAASKVVMRSGRHFAQFMVVAVDRMLFGVIRPGWDVEGEREADGEGPPDVEFESKGDHCFFDTEDGHRMPGDHSWEGAQNATERNDRIGMLLDLDQGSMTIWKNDEKLGVMQAEGLRGPLCWAVALFFTDAGVARIGSGSLYSNSMPTV